jgi:hypothetical protein
MPKKRAAYPPSAARCVGGRLGTHGSQPEKDSSAHLTTLWHVPFLFSTDKHPNLPRCRIFKDSTPTKIDFANETDLTIRKSWPTRTTDSRDMRWRAKYSYLSGWCICGAEDMKVAAGTIFAPQLRTSQWLAQRRRSTRCTQESPWPNSLPDAGCRVCGTCNGFSMEMKVFPNQLHWPTKKTWPMKHTRTGKDVNRKKCHH